MAYSKDFRRRVIDYLQEGHTNEELQETFKVYPSTVHRWIKLEKTTGSLKPKYPETREMKIDLEKLKQAVEEKSDAYLPELALKFNCTRQAIFYALKKLRTCIQ
jgi:transposase